MCGYKRSIMKFIRPTDAVKEQGARDRSALLGFLAWTKEEINWEFFNSETEITKVLTEKVVQ